MSRVARRGETDEHSGGKHVSGSGCVDANPVDFIRICRNADWYRFTFQVKIGAISTSGHN